MDPDDVETHYQLSLLYLTMMETTLLESIDAVRSPLAAMSIQSMESDLCSGRRPVPVLVPDVDADDDRLSVNYAEYPIGRGVHSPWYRDRIEVHSLCARHLALTMASWGDSGDGAIGVLGDGSVRGRGRGRDPVLDPVVFGSYITSARLLYLECTAPFCMDSVESASLEVQRRKLSLGIDRLQSALEVGGRDATLHHDLGLLLSHRLVGRYEEAVVHWKSAAVLDGGNPLYDGQIGYLYQYHVVGGGSCFGAMRHYERSLQQKRAQAQIWNNLGILWAQSANDGAHIAEATECWRRALALSPWHCEAHRNLGNAEWLHFTKTHRGEVHLQRAIAMISSAKKACDSMMAGTGSTGYGDVLQSSSISFDIDSVMAQSMATHHGNPGCPQLMEVRQRKSYCKALRAKLVRFEAQCKSDYGGLLLMMLRFDGEAERQLEAALRLDADCVSAHYYLGKHCAESANAHSLSLGTTHLGQIQQRTEAQTRARTHLERYIERERVQNVANRAHAHQILGDLAVDAQSFKAAQRHFARAIELSTDRRSGDSLLPQSAQCRIHCGFARSIVLREEYKLFEKAARGRAAKESAQSLLHRLRRNQWSKTEHGANAKNHSEATKALSPLTVAMEPKRAHSEQSDIDRLSRNLEMAKKHFRRILKLDAQFVAAPLGLAAVLGRFEGKSLLCDKHYGEVIRLCQAKLLQIAAKYKAELKRQCADRRRQSADRRTMHRLSNRHKLTLCALSPKMGVFLRRQFVK